MLRNADAALEAAYFTAWQWLRVVAATEGLDAGLIHRKMRRATAGFFIGRSARQPIEGRLFTEQSLLRVKPPGRCAVNRIITDRSAPFRKRKPIVDHPNGLQPNPLNRSILDKRHGFVLDS
jgi:hypothetical protein